jgi:hypothetical protein
MGQYQHRVGVVSSLLLATRLLLLLLYTTTGMADSIKRAARNCVGRHSLIRPSLYMCCSSLDPFFGSDIHLNYYYI